MFGKSYNIAASLSFFFLYICYNFSERIKYTYSKGLSNERKRTIIEKRGRLM